VAAAAIMGELILGDLAPAGRRPRSPATPEPFLNHDPATGPKDRAPAARAGHTAPAAER